jgi:flavin reductase (NADH)
VSRAEPAGEGVTSVMTGPLSAPPTDFRAFMAGFPSGVSIVTAYAADGSRRGMTCSSVSSVAVDPPTLLVCLRAGSPTLAAALESGSFAVNLLHAGAQHVAELFASARPDRFERVPWATDDAACGPHLAAGTHAVADCRVSGVLAVGDHVVTLGSVVRVHGTDGHRPLLYGLRRYATWPEF